MRHILEPTPLKGAAVILSLLSAAAIVGLDHFDSGSSGGPDNYSFAVPSVPATPWVKSGTTGLKVQFDSIDSFNNVDVYKLKTPDDGPGVQELRVLRPTNPKTGVAHNFLFVLPVAAGVDNTEYDDGLDYLQFINAQNEYNLTIIEPSFPIGSWDANSSTDSHVQYETFITQQLEPWVRANLSITGEEQNWVIGFSRSAIGAEDLTFKYPKIFSVAGAWDAPFLMTSTSQYPDSEANYGANSNFTTNYELSPDFIAAHAAPFRTSERLWIGGYALFGYDVTQYAKLLTDEGVQYASNMTPAAIDHSWDSGWMPDALSAMERMSRSINTQQK